MNEHYSSLNDLLKKEFEQHVVDLTDEIYGDDLEYNPDKDDDAETKEDLTNADDCLEQLYYELNKYVNGESEDALYNRDTQTSLLCKLMIISEYYEYCSIYINELDDINKQIYIRLDSELTMENAIKLYDKNHREILEMYDFILSIYINSPDTMDKVKLEIMKKGLINQIVKINPMIVFDYRFLLGSKFEGEHIRSVQIGNALSVIVQALVEKQVLDEKRIVMEIQKLLESDSDLAYFVNEHKSYMISNIYETIKASDNDYLFATEFIDYLEKINVDDILENIELSNKTLSQVLYIFYVLNKKGISEQTINESRRKIKDKKQKQLIKSYNPYYLEEEMYFQNGGE